MSFSWQLSSTLQTTVYAQKLFCQIENIFDSVKSDSDLNLIIMTNINKIKGDLIAGNHADFISINIVI